MAGRKGRNAQTRDGANFSFWLDRETREDLDILARKLDTNATGLSRDLIKRLVQNQTPFFPPPGYELKAGGEIFRALCTQADALIERQRRGRPMRLMTNVPVCTYIDSLHGDPAWAYQYLPKLAEAARAGVQVERVYIVDCGLPTPEGRFGAKPPSAPEAILDARHREEILRLIGPRDGKKKVRVYFVDVRHVVPAGGEDRVWLNSLAIFDRLSVAATWETTLGAPTRMAHSQIRHHVDFWRRYYDKLMAPARELSDIGPLQAYHQERSAKNLEALDAMFADVFARVFHAPERAWATAEPEPAGT